jgi:mono/diheme cytochrome c family protein
MPERAAQGLGAMLRAAVLAVVASAVACTPAFSQENAAARGAAVVEQWCRLCHLRAGDRPDPDMAPPFEELVGRPGRDRAFYTSFMAEDHFPMTTFRLFDSEKTNVVEYLLSLQPE